MVEQFGGVYHVQHGTRQEANAQLLQASPPFKWFPPFFWLTSTISEGATSSYLEGLISEPDLPHMCVTSSPTLAFILNVSPSVDAGCATPKYRSEIGMSA